MLHCELMASSRGPQNLVADFMFRDCHLESHLELVSCNLQASSSFTLGRGGSDLTASLVGAGVSASEIQVWTDVDGMLSCNPRVLHGGYRLRSLSYEEADEMARLGAKVLCPKTVAPAVRQGIPIMIRNSRRPQLEDAIRQRGMVKCATARTGMAIIHLFVPFTGMLRGITEALSDRFVQNHVKVEFVQAQADGVSFAVHSSVHLPELIPDIDLADNSGSNQQTWVTGQSKEMIPRSCVRFLRVPLTTSMQL